MKCSNNFSIPDGLESSTPIALRSGFALTRAMSYWMKFGSTEPVTPKTKGAPISYDQAEAGYLGVYHKTETIF